MRSAVLLGFRTLAREWRSGDLAVLFLALFVAVAALTGVGFLSDRIERAMQLQASEVLGADLRMWSPDVPDKRYAQEAARRGMRSASVLATMSVVLKGDLTQLSNVYAVSADYPLRGSVRTAAVAFGEPMPTQGIPGPGEVWPDSRLLAALDARAGDLLTVGAAQLRVTRVLIARPDQGSGFVELSPSLVMNEADVPATRLIQPGSRVGYFSLFAGERAQVEALSVWLKANVKPVERFRDIAEVSPEVNSASVRASRFLSLASLVGVLLCAVAIAMTARRYVKRHLDLAALLKTLGAPQATVLTISLVQLACIALLATAVGSVAGYLAQSGLLAIVHDMLAVELPAASLRPVAMGLVAAFLLLAGFAVPSMLQLSRVPAIRVLRRDIGPPRLGTVLAYGPAALAVGLLILWITGEVRMSLWFVLGLVVALLTLALAAWLLVGIVGRLRGRVGIAWRYGAANLARRRAESIVQIVALGLGLSALLLLAVIRGGLVDDWRARLPTDAPNYFFVNISPQERESFQTLLSDEGGKVTRMLPMIRGRMLAINEEPLAQRRFPGGRGEGFATREQNLTWSAEVGRGNTVTEGAWFTANDQGKPLVSVATEYQESLQLKLGDTLTFDIAGETVKARISSFRRVQWDTMEPNFFLVFPPGLLEGAAGTYMASAQFHPTNPATVAQLVRRFPGVSIFDVESILTQVRSIIDKAVLAVQSVFIFTLLAGVVVLLAAVQATREERRYESAMLRTLGASRRTVLVGVLVEFTLIGAMAGLVAGAVAFTGGYFLATKLLEIPYRPDYLLCASGAALGAVLVCIAGYLATRSALSQPPMSVLRHA